MMKIGKKLLSILILCVLIGCLCACDSPVNFLSSSDTETETNETGVIDASAVFVIGTESCSQSDARVIIASYQKRYDELNGINLWDHDYGEHAGLESYVKDIALTQLANVYSLDIIAREQGYVLSDSDKSKCEAAANELEKNLSKQEKQYFNASVSDIEKLYERYVLAYHFYNELRGASSSEISDDEARVMQIRQIHVKDQEKAQSILSSLQQGGDFVSLAATYSDCDYSQKPVDRFTFSDDVTEIIFNLMSESYSEIIPMEEGYSIFYVVSAYDESLTDDNKASVLAAKNQKMLDDLYAQYGDSLASVLDENNWSQVIIDKNLELANPSFIEVFQMYFEESE